MVRFLKRVTCLAVTLSLVSGLAAYASPPQAVIDGDKEVLPGDLIVLSAEDSTADPGALVWILGNSEKRYLEVNGGRQLVFASGTPGQYRFYLVAAGVDGDRVLLDRAVHVVTVRGSSPVPPGPTPGPTPPTPQPDGVLGLVKASREGLSRVSDPSGRTALASAQRAHASAVAAGAFQDAGAILNGWRTANRMAVDSATWTPWGQAVSTALQALYAGGRLRSNSEWAAAFDEVAQGLGG